MAIKTCVLLAVVLFAVVNCYYIKPTITKSLITTCECGFIEVEQKCDSVFHDAELDCGYMSIYYPPTTHPECSEAHITCVKQGGTWQSTAVVGKLVPKPNATSDDWSLLQNRKLGVNRVVLKCENGKWADKDMEGAEYLSPLQVQCASETAAQAFDYYVMG